MTDYVASHYIAFPISVAEYEGVTLTVEVSDGRQPHQAPPGHLEVWVRRPDDAGGKPGAVITGQAICRFFHLFCAGELVTETQAHNNSLRKQLEEAAAAEVKLRKQAGMLNARVKELEGQVARQRADVLRELVETQVGALRARIGED